MRTFLPSASLVAILILVAVLLRSHNGAERKPAPPVQTVQPAPVPGNRLANGGFEDGMKGWHLWGPPESKAAGCTFITVPSELHSGGHQARLESRATTRFGILPDGPPLRVQPGERYRITAWVKAGADFKAEPGTPGVVLRATLFEFPGKDHPGGHLFVGAQGVAIGNPAPLADPAPPREWTKLEAVVEIPAGANHLVFFVFVWRASGTLSVDDVSLVRVPRSETLTPVLH